VARLLGVSDQVIGAYLAGENPGIGHPETHRP
jgi:hypothetical protein